MSGTTNTASVPVTDDCEITRAKVLAYSDKVRCVDTDGNLELFCYADCNNLESDFVKKCRGLVFCQDKLLVKSFPYAFETCHTERETLTSILSEFDKWTFYQSHEGALIRMFFHSGKWYVSTHRKFDAFRSKWGSRESFGSLFQKALEKEVIRNADFRSFIQPTEENTESSTEDVLTRLKNVLNKDFQYFFLLLNNQENRIVCNPPGDDKPSVLHVGTFTSTFEPITQNICLMKPKRIQVNNLSDLLTYIACKIDITKLQGVIAFGPHGEQVKIYHTDYQELFNVRGNEPSIKYRYLQLRMDKTLSDKLAELYPDMTEKFDEYEDILYGIAQNIMSAYVKRYMKHKYIIVPREEFKVMKALNDWHLQDRAGNRVTINRVINFMNNNCTATELNHMIRNVKSEELKKTSSESKAEE